MVRKGAVRETGSATKTQRIANGHARAAIVKAATYPLALQGRGNEDGDREQSRADNAERCITSIIILFPSRYNGLLHRQIGYTSSVGIGAATSFRCVPSWHPADNVVRFGSASLSQWLRRVRSCTSGTVRGAAITEHPFGDAGH